MRKVFLGFSAVLVLTVVAQFFLAASAAFDTAPKDESFQYHRSVGMGIVAFAILSTIVAGLARMPGRLIGMTGLVAGLGVVQALIAMLAGAFESAGGTSTTGSTLVFGLHAVNGLFMLKTAGGVARQARELARQAPVLSPPPAADGSASGADLGPAAGSAQPAS